jgi:ADP-ribosylglycohydrolase
VTGLRERFRGCLLGGAVGDALGAGVEFWSLTEIRERLGPAGVTGYVPAYGRTGAITDDTQMTLFTAEGLLDGARSPAAGDGGQVPTIWQAYQRWLLTQNGSPRAARKHRGGAGGGLLAQEFLWSRRAPGTTCLRALTLGRPGSLEHAVNNSKGCGGVMRVAPVGLAAGDPFTLGCQAAALTHGHPAGYRAAGAFALMVGEIIRGTKMRQAAAAAISRVRLAGDSYEVAHALQAAVTAADSQPATPETIEHLGGGWVAEEALAIAVYCALTATDFRSGVLLAVNHSGDSDSTGAICGNLLGAALGAGAIDPDLLSGLEGREVIEQTADRLYELFARQRRPTAEHNSAGQYPA